MDLLIFEEGKHLFQLQKFHLTVTGKRSERNRAKQMIEEFLLRNCIAAGEKCKSAVLVGSDHSDATSYSFEALVNENYTKWINRRNFHAALVSTLSKENWKLTKYESNFEKEITMYWFFERESI